MKAVGYRQSLPSTDPEALIDVELPKPVAGARDLLVSVKAVSVNPVDTKVRLRRAPAPGEIKVLGWDVAGVVEAVGADVTLFAPGDEVWYAGAIDRQGANAEYHVVDERLVGRKPSSLAFEQAAALPLTTITAWELLFDRLGVPADADGDTLLVIGAAGGVGSILLQLARRLTRLTLVGSASRPDTADWVRAHGAHHVIDHQRPLAEEMQAIGIPAPRYVAGLTHTDRHFAEIVKLIAPQGRLAIIDDPQSLDIVPLKYKCVSVAWEYMFARSLYQTPDMIQQHALLNTAAAMVDRGEIKTTVNGNFGSINAANLRRAHQFIESGQAMGKIVLAGFE
jgi:zinc-binding alcohol dehydrogenase family protein